MRTIGYGPHPSQVIDVHGTHGPGAVLIHGGYWRRRFGRRLMTPLAADLVARRRQAANIEYRRIGDRAPWRAPFDDVLDAIRSAADLFAGPVALIGHSAGGHLALWASRELPDLVGATIALAPLADLVAADRLQLSDGATAELLGGSATGIPDRYAWASPIARVPTGVPTLVVHGELDRDVPIAQGRSYAEKAAASGDDVELRTPAAANHFTPIDPASAVWADTAEWLATRMGR